MLTGTRKPAAGYIYPLFHRLATKRTKETPMKKKYLQGRFNNAVFLAARASELLMSFIIMLVIVCMIISLIARLPQNINLLEFESDTFTHFLASALSLVVGVEFVKMLCRHTTETIIEVLLFATARQMVVEHLDCINTLIGTLAIAVLFATRKYLLVRQQNTQKQAPADCMEGLIDPVK